MQHQEKQKINYQRQFLNNLARIITDENQLGLQSYLPSDIKIFLIRPPALNDIQRWFREYMQSQINKTEK